LNDSGMILQDIENTVEDEIFSENPTFKLENFEGPLDLLLSLLSKNKLNIYDIPISFIFEQYMEYIHGMEKLHMDFSSSFIVMAAQLMLIKSRMLLPPKESEQDPRQELVDLLLEYQKASKTAKVLHEREQTFTGIYEKPPEKIEIDPEYTLTHDIKMLTEAMLRVYTRKSDAEETENDKNESIDQLMKATRQVSVNEKILHVLKRLIQKDKCEFTLLFSEAKTKNEIVATFLAVLELIKGKRIHISSMNEDYSECELSLIRN